MKDFWEDSIEARALARVGRAPLSTGVSLAAGLLSLACCAVATPARACSLAAPFSHATPDDGESLPSGEVLVALHYHVGVPGGVDAFHVEDAEGEPISVSVTILPGAALLRFDTSSTTEVTVYGPDAFASDEPLATYAIDADMPDTTPPSAPTVALGQAACTACTEPRDSCCERPDTSGRLDTTVRFTLTQPGTIIGWVNGAGELLGILDPRAAYHSAPTFTGDARTPPASAPVVAMNVAGVMSTPVTWALVEQGACDANPDPDPPNGDPMANGEGCRAAPPGPSRAALLAVSAALVVLFGRRRRYPAQR
ncbi:MAG: MYXO-CTERM sorting domain-containing protein [Polyangiales bacterium]